jgi:hypothetical protein
MVYWISYLQNRDIVNLIGVATASVVAGVVSYLLIETPTRRRRGTTVRIVGVCAVILLIAAQWIQVSGGLTGRLVGLDRYYPQSTNPDNQALRAATWDYLRSNPWPRSSSSKIWVILGDSHGKDMYNALHLNRTSLEGVEVQYAGTNFTPSSRKKCFARRPQGVSDQKNRLALDKSSLIIISDSFTKKSHLECLESFLRSSPELLNKIVIFSSQGFDFPPRYIRQKAKGNIEELRDTSLIMQRFFAAPQNRKLTTADYVLLSGSTEPREEAAELLFLSSRNKSLLNLNRDLQTLARKYGARYVEKFDYLGDVRAKTCPAFN